MARVRRTAVLLALSLLITALMPAAPAHALRKISLSSGGFQFSAAAGQVSEGDLLVTNDGDEQIQVLVYTADQITEALDRVCGDGPPADNDFAQAAARRTLRRLQW